MFTQSYKSNSDKRAHSKILIIVSGTGDYCCNEESNNEKLECRRAPLQPATHRGPVPLRKAKYAGINSAIILYSRTVLSFIITLYECYVFIIFINLHTRWIYEIECQLSVAISEELFL